MKVLTTPEPPVEELAGSWTCMICNRKMDKKSKRGHLTGKPHSKEAAKLAQFISSLGPRTGGGFGPPPAPRLPLTSSNKFLLVNTNTTKPDPRDGERLAIKDYGPSWQEAKRLYLLDSEHNRQTMPLPLLDGESDIKGCRAIVTGANTGIGYEVAKGLLLRGIGTVILACKNESKGLAAAEALRKETGREWGAVEFRHLDLSWFGSVRAFAKQYIDDKIPLHVLVHNAGVHGIGACQAFTADSLDLIMQVNHVAPLLLTLLLLPAMFGAVWRFLPPKAARVIWVTSDEAELMPFPEAVLPRPVTALCHKKRLFSPKDKLTQYATAKLLNIMCARELLERLFLQRIELKGSVRVAAAHPGRVETSLGKTDSWLGNIFRSEAASFGDWDDIVLRTPEEGAKTVLLVASYEGRKIWGQKGYSKDIQSMPVFENMEIMRAYPQLAQSRDLRKKVWTDTVRLMKLKEGEVHERYL